MRSKRRICADCQEGENYFQNIGILYGNDLRMAPIIFAVEEYRRRHPLDTVTSQVERYLVSLPDRSKMLRDYFGSWLDDKDSGVDLAIFEGIIADYLMIALISDYDASKFTDPWPEHYKLKLHELRTKFIKDRNRTCPNDQELTRWMQENINDRYSYEDHWFKIQYCKVFENPKKIKNIIDDVRTTKYTVIVHFSSPNGYWLQYNI